MGHFAGEAHADKVPMALIVDSPWIPGISGSSTWTITSTRRCGPNRTSRSCASSRTSSWCPLVDGIRDGRRAVGAWRKDQVWQDNTPSEYTRCTGWKTSISSRLRGRGGCLRRADAAPDRDASTTDPRPRLHPADGHRAGRSAPPASTQHDEPDDRARRESGRLPQTDRPVRASSTGSTPSTR